MLYQLSYLGAETGPRAGWVEWRGL